MRYAILLMLLCAGCADEQFDLLQPVAAHIGEKEFVSVRLAPVTYDLISDDGRLVMEIHNDNDLAVLLVPEQTYLVDPAGRTRLVRPFAVAPHSYFKLIFPPPVPQERDDGGYAYGVGIETAGGFHHRDASGFGGAYDPTYYRPIENPDPNFYWPWDQGPVRFHFVFSDGSKTYTNDLVIERVKE